MSDFIGDRRCVTHHYGCPCREERLAQMVAALELIAAGKRPDGTYNRSREACEQLAREALGRDKE